mgnify:CR=1 FL=1
MATRPGLIGRNGTGASDRHSVFVRYTQAQHDPFNTSICSGQEVGDARNDNQTNRNAVATWNACAWKVFAIYRAEPSLGQSAGRTWCGYDNERADIASLPPISGRHGIESAAGELHQPPIATHGEAEFQVWPLC